MCAQQQSAERVHQLQCGHIPEPDVTFGKRGRAELLIGSHFKTGKVAALRENRGGSFGFSTFRKLRPPAPATRIKFGMAGATNTLAFPTQKTLPAGPGERPNCGRRCWWGLGRT